jgi:hypothetical protein
MPSHSNATTFTRYLYLKTDVKQALIGAVLNKDLTSSMYWVFELFFSGFQEETMDTLWQIYYDFYATLNPLLEAYMKKKEASVKNDKDREMFVATFISNLVVRKYTTDVYMLNKVTNEIYVDDEDAKLTLEQMLTTKNFEAITHKWASSSDKDRLVLVKDVNTYFANQNIKTKIEKKNTNKHVNTQTIVMARLMQGFETHRNNEEKENAKKKKNLYVIPEQEYIEEHRTKEVQVNQMCYKFFRTVVKYSPDQYNMVSLNRSNVSENTIDTFRDGRKWLFAAYHTTPLWHDRIVKGGGIVNEDATTITWKSDDHEEDFYEKYWFDTDEQPLSIQQMCIPLSKRDSKVFHTFQEKYNNFGMYFPCEEVLECLCE